MAGRNTKYEQVDLATLTPSDDTLPPYRTSWGEDVVQHDDEKKEGKGRRLSWTAARDITKQRTMSFVKATGPFLQSKAWPAIKRFRFTKKQTYGFLLLMLFGVLPLMVVGIVFRGNGTGSGSPYAYFFAAKTISCGDALGTPQNSTVAGWEALFVLDTTGGNFAFSQVKTIDVAWDIFVGRGAQLFAWWASYSVFSDALLRVIERHPASYETFTHICLNGACLASIWALLKDLFRTRSKRTWALFFYMLLSILYVLSLPVWISAMTGYVSTTVAWVDIGDGNNIIPASLFEPTYVVYNAGNVTLNSKCLSPDSYSDYVSFNTSREYDCDCRLNNGTIVSYPELREMRRRLAQELRYNRTTVYSSDRPYYDIYNGAFSSLECKYDFPNNTKEFTIYSDKTFKCNQDYKLNIDGKDYEADSLNATNGYCLSGTGYDYSSIQDKSRCLPDTANQTYQWGFSTMLCGVFIFFQFGWALSMYIVWQDAQFNSKVVKSGYKMTQLRAVFTLATAARWRTGLGNRELVKTDAKKLKEQLHGSKKKNRAEVGIEIFEGVGKNKDFDESGDGDGGESEEGVRRRDGRVRDQDDEE